MCFYNELNVRRYLDTCRFIYTHPTLFYAHLSCRNKMMCVVGSSGGVQPRRGRRRMTSASPERWETERRDCKPWRSNWSSAPGLTGFTAAMILFDLRCINWQGANVTGHPFHPVWDVLTAGVVQTFLAVGITVWGPSMTRCDESLQCRRMLGFPEAVRERFSWID